MITYSVVSFKEIRPLIQGLLQDHWQEIARNKDKIKLNPDYRKYEILEEAGVLHTVVAKDGEKIVGYFISFVQENIHYQDHVFAVNDVLYLDPSYRGTGVAKEMFEYVEKALKELGVSVISLHIKVDNRFDTLCETMGYSENEVTYSKYIGD